MNSLHGRWVLLKAELDGQGAPDEIAAQTELILHDEIYEVRFAGQAVDRGTVEVNVAAAIKTLLLCGVEGTNAGRRIPAIYQQVGDRLRVCYGLDGQLPTQFATAVGESRYLATYRRVTS